MVKTPKKFDRTAALDALTRLKRRGTQSLKILAYNRTLPMLSIVFRQRFGRMSFGRHIGRMDYHDREDVLQSAALRLWQVIDSQSYPQFETTAHLNSWMNVVVYRWLCQAYEEVPDRTRDDVVDYDHARTVWGRPQIFSARSAEDEIFLRELPDALLSRVVKTCRLPEGDHAAVRYIANQLMLGRDPVVNYLASALRVARCRIQFLIDYVTVRVRWALYRIFTEDMGGVIAHPSMQVFSNVGD